MDDVNMEYTMHFTFRQEWVDERLLFYSGSQKHIVLSSVDQMIFLPDTFFQVCLYIVTVANYNVYNIKVKTLFTFFDVATALKLRIKTLIMRCRSLGYISYFCQTKCFYPMEVRSIYVCLLHLSTPETQVPD